MRQADTTLAHNAISDSTYTSICAGWGWGEKSYMRNVRAAAPCTELTATRGDL